MANASEFISVINDRFSVAEFNAMETEPRDPRQLHRYFLMPMNPAGVRLTPENALMVSVVWACVDAISKPVSASPWNVFERLSNGNRKLLIDDQVYYLLNVRPNEDMTAIGFREAMMIMALTWGNAYAEIVRDMVGRPAALYPITPDRVEPMRDQNGDLIYRITNDNGEWVYLEQRDILHIKGPGINGLMGDHVIAKAAGAIGLTMAAERFGATYFGNNTFLGGTLTYPHKLDDPTYERLMAAFEARHKGPNKAWRPFVAENGITYEPASVEADKAQFIETRKFQIAEVCRYYGVPPHKVADLDRSTNNNIEHQGIEFNRDALRPWAERNQQEVDCKLFSTRGRPRFTRIDLEWLSQGDAFSRAQYYQIMRNIGAYSANDILKLEGKDTIGPEGDVRIVNSASIRLEDVGNNYTKQEGADKKSEGDGAIDKNETLNSAFRALFTQVYDRFATRLRNRLADMERSSKTPEEREEWMRSFRTEQTKALHDALVKPCQALTQACGVDTFSATLSRGLAVACEGADAESAAKDLIAQFLKKTG